MIVDDDNDAYCPGCNGKNFVKNGRVRKMQRFRCRLCDLNFVSSPKHRWPPSSKISNLVLLRAGIQLENDAEAARLDRWQLEAKEHHSWFIRALAEHAIFAIDQRKETMEIALTSTWELYAFVTQHDPEHFYDALATELYVDMFKIGDARFQEELMAWLTAHSSITDDPN